MPFEKSDQQPTLSATRRRLLKAMAGATPMVMTLPVGAQTAGTSLVCTAKPVSPLEQPANVIAGTDSWVRKRVDVWTVTLKRHAAGRYFEIQAWEINGTLYAAEGQPNGYTVGTPVPMFGDDEHPGHERVRVRTDSLLYYVSPDGSSAQAYPLNAGNGNPLSTSCWTSITGGTQILG
jgi:hypothetical protein